MDGMLTEFTRDHAFTVAWFGLMAMVWFGWAQEDPPRAWRWKLGAASMVGVALAGSFGYGVLSRWNDGTALDGRYPWFGVLVAIEVIAAGIGCIVLARSGRSRWMAWWVAVVVAAHFAPLAWLLDDMSLAVFSVLQLAALVGLIPRLRASEAPTSRLVGPVMGATLLAFAVISALVFVLTTGSPW